MRRTMIWIAAAVLVATPAAAQNETTDANASTVTADNAVAVNDTAMNDMAAAPAADMNADLAAPPEEGAPAAEPAPERERGFPWGVIGLVGLVGLLGRRRGD
jgi:hypothetical protein